MFLIISEAAQRVGPGLSGHQYPLNHLIMSAAETSLFPHP